MHHVPQEGFSPQPRKNPRGTMRFIVLTFWISEWLQRLPLNLVQLPLRSFGVDS